MLLSRKLKKDFTYRGLGGKTFYIEFEVSKDEVLTKALVEGNWAWTDEKTSTIFGQRNYIMEKSMV